MTDPQPTLTATAGLPLARYGEPVVRLIEGLPPSQLGPKTAADAQLRRSLRERLERLSDRDFALPDRPLVDTQAAACCRAGLWLACDFLDESHAISQEIETASGSYWHGIMHRREPDPDNAKYWFRRVRQHPVFRPLAAAAKAAAAANVAVAANVAAADNAAANVAAADNAAANVAAAKSAAANFASSYSSSSSSAAAESLGAAAYLATQTDWDAFRFVDLCERLRDEGGAGERLCREIARIEWRLLFDYCYRQASGLE
jgi:hypothetical protein